jgi:hypothetical protein
MRFHHMARRIFLAPALGLALAAAVTACSSSSSSSTTPAATASSSTPAASSPAATSPAAGGTSASGGSAATIATIKANWEAFFSASTPTAKRIQFLQNGQVFSAEIKSMSGGGLASQASAQVTSVTLTSPTQATVKYNILLSGSPVLKNQTGTAVYENGIWKVGDASFCGLLTLQNNGKAPSVCSSAG